MRIVVFLFILFYFLYKMNQLEIIIPNEPAFFFFFFITSIQSNKSQCALNLSTKSFTLIGISTKWQCVFHEIRRLFLVFPFFFQLHSLVRICLKKFSHKKKKKIAIHFIIFLNQFNAFLLLIIKIVKKTNAQFISFSNTSHNIDSMHFFCDSFVFMYPNNVPIRSV